MNKDIIGFDKKGNMFYYEENTNYFHSNKIFFLYFKTNEAIDYLRQHEKEARYLICACIETEETYPLGAQMLYVVYDLSDDLLIYASELRDVMPSLVKTEKKVRKILGIR